MMLFIVAGSRLLNKSRDDSAVQPAVDVTSD